MRKRIFKIGIRVAITFAILLVFFVVVSLVVIDRGQPTVAGELSPQELKKIRRAARSSAARSRYPCIGFPTVRFRRVGIFSRNYSYRILSVEVVDADTVLVFTRTNSYYPDGMRRPDFFARRVDGVWQSRAARTSPLILPRSTGMRTANPA